MNMAKCGELLKPFLTHFYHEVQRMEPLPVVVLSADNKTTPEAPDKQKQNYQQGIFFIL